MDAVTPSQPYIMTLGHGCKEGGFPGQYTQQYGALMRIVSWLYGKTGIFPPAATEAECRICLPCRCFYGLSVWQRCNELNKYAWRCVQ